jgi:hypothetical protein
MEIGSQDCGKTVSANGKKETELRKDHESGVDAKLISGNGRRDPLYSFGGGLGNIASQLEMEVLIKSEGNDAPRIRNMLLN